MAVLRLCGHAPIGPSPVADKSNERMHEEMPRGAAEEIDGLHLISEIISRSSQTEEPAFTL